MDQRNFRIGQISDLHLDFGEKENVSVEKFQVTLRDAEKFDLDFLVLSGDITEHSYRREYEIFFEVMKTYSHPWCVMAGNHDCSEDLARYSSIPLKLQNGEYFDQREVKGVPFFFLDTSLGSVSKQQLVWLKEEAKQKTGEIFLFMHHPPCLCGHLFMDSLYPLKNWEEVKKEILEIPNLHAVFAGHYHSEMTLDLGKGKMLYLTPSTQMQLNPEISSFDILSTVPGWRYIEYKEGKIRTEVRYL